MLAARLVAISAVVLCTLGGCTTCCTPYDYDYSAHGGRWQRVNPTHGRVGSSFSQVSSQVVDEEEVVPEKDEKGKSVLQANPHVRQIFRRQPVPDE